MKKEKPILWRPEVHERTDTELLYAIIIGAGEADFCEYELKKRGWTEADIATYLHSHRRH